MPQPPRLHQWLRYGDSPIPAFSRQVRRRKARQRAITEYGSVDAFLDSVLAGAAVLAPSATKAAPGPSAGSDIVHLSTYPVHPLNAGGQIRTFHMAKALAERHRGLESTIISVTTRPEDAGYHRLGDNLDEVCVHLPGAYQEREAAIRLVTDDVAITDIALSILWPHLDDLVAELIARLPGARAVVAAQPFLAAAHRHLAQHVPLIYDAHNDESALKATILPDNEGGKWLLARTNDVESYALSSASLVTATTHDDLATLRDRSDIVRGAVIPNGVDTSSVAFSCGGDRLTRRLELVARFGLDGERPIALFVGSSHQPNLDAAHLIIETARHHADVTFLMVGDHSDRLIHKVPGNVVRTGQVDESTLALALGGADVALNPMLSGGGSNLKLLRYLAAGLPVVSTAIGARGIDPVSAGVHLATEFDVAEATSDLLDEHSDERAVQGRRYVESERDWAALGRRFAELASTEVGL